MKVKRNTARVFVASLLFLGLMGAMQPLQTVRATTTPHDPPPPVVPAVPSGLILPDAMTVDLWELPSSPAIEGIGVRSDPKALARPNQSEVIPLGMPTPGTSFAGLGNGTNGISTWPPDPVGDVGTAYYVQAINTSVGIFDKTGVLLYSTSFNSIFATSDNLVCSSGHNRGSPLVLYDHLDDRWIIADLAWKDDLSDGGYHLCLAISESTDPAGWIRYGIALGTSFRPDSPAMGLWPDAIYVSHNLLDSGGNLQGARVWAFKLADLVNGAAVHNVYADLTSQYAWLLPSNLRGAIPPSGSPNYLVSNDLSSNYLDVWKFQVDWITDPGNPTGSLTGPTQVTRASDGTLPSSIPQQSGDALNSLGDRLMLQSQYRNFGGTESLWLAHMAESGVVAGIRWYQLDVTGGTIDTAPVQTGTFQPDGNHRWLPSLAVDGVGNMAVGYSVSSSGMYPGIRYAGRLVTDTLNTLGQGEATLLDGTAAQSGASGLWGTHSSMTIDPSDDCTFWYTNEYYVSTGTNWQTRIGKFEFAACPFADVPVLGKEWMAPWIEAFYDAGITTGCGANPLIYCPEEPVTRAAMAVFTLRTLHGASYVPPTASHFFFDLPVAGKEWMEPWVDEFYREGLTTGCGVSPLRFCPENGATRAAMAVFLLRALEGSSYVPPAAHHYFDDLPVTGKEWMEPWVDEFYDRGITTGCGEDPLSYCPENTATRAAMAVFIDRAYGLYP